MGKLIESLTPEQRARLPEFRRKWESISLCTHPADRPRAEAAIARLYRLAKLEKPCVVWLPCPLTAALSAVVYAALRNDGLAKHGAPGEAVAAAVGIVVRSAVDPDLRDVAGSEVTAAVHAALERTAGFEGRTIASRMKRFEARSPVDWKVDRAICHAVHSAVDSKVGFGVSPEVYCAMGCSALIPSMDLEIEHSVAAAVYAAASALGKSGILDPTCQAGGAFSGGAYRSADCARADFYSEALGVSIDRSHLDLTESCGRCWMLDSVCFASERAHTIRYDERRRLHCADGQSIGYASGWGFWHWRGVRVPRDVIEHPERISMARITKERNLEVRRVMIERYGEARFLVESGARLIHQDARGKLWRTYVAAAREPTLIVQVRNCTPEPDGSFKEYFLRVPPSMRTATEAVAWTFGMTAHTYRPRAES